MLLPAMVQTPPLLLLNSQQLRLRPLLKKHQTQEQLRVRTVHMPGMPLRLVQQLLIQGRSQQGTALVALPHMTGVVRITGRSTYMEALHSMVQAKRSSINHCGLRHRLPPTMLRQPLWMCKHKCCLQQGAPHQRQLRQHTWLMRLLRLLDRAAAPHSHSKVTCMRRLHSMVTLHMRVAA
jgi:hypothetical protein